MGGAAWKLFAMKFAMIVFFDVLRNAKTLNAMTLQLDAFISLGIVRFKQNANVSSPPGESQTQSHAGKTDLGEIGHQPATPCSCGSRF